MKQLAIALALAGTCVLGLRLPRLRRSRWRPTKPRWKRAMPPARRGSTCSTRSAPKALKPGQYVWRDVPDAPAPSAWSSACRTRWPISIAGTRWWPPRPFPAASDDKPTPIGIFSVLDKRPMYHSKKYDNAPMPWMQRIDQYGIALHAGYNPGDPRQPRLRAVAERVRQEALLGHRRRHAGLYRRVTAEGRAASGAAPVCAASRIVRLACPGETVSLLANTILNFARLQRCGFQVGSQEPETLKVLTVKIRMLAGAACAALTTLLCPRQRRPPPKSPAGGRCSTPPTRPWQAFYAGAQRRALVAAQRRRHPRRAS